MLTTFESIFLWQRLSCWKNTYKRQFAKVDFFGILIYKNFYGQICEKGNSFGMSIFSLIIKGGILMIPLSLCSVYSLGIIVERLIRYRKAKGNLNKLTQKLEPLIIGNKVSEAKLLCEESRGIIPGLFRVALQELQKKSWQIKLNYLYWYLVSWKYNNISL